MEEPAPGGVDGCSASALPARADATGSRRESGRAMKFRTQLRDDALEAFRAEGRLLQDQFSQLAEALQRDLERHQRGTERMMLEQFHGLADALAAKLQPAAAAAGTWASSRPSAGGPPTRSAGQVAPDDPTLGATREQSAPEGAKAAQGRHLHRGKSWGTKSPRPPIRDPEDAKAVQPAPEKLPEEAPSPRAQEAPTLPGTAPGDREETVSTPASLPRRRFSSSELTTGISSDTLREMVKRSISTEVYNVKNLYKDSGLCQAIARASWFEGGTLVVILLNAIWMAVEADMNDSKNLSSANPVFQVVEHGFCAVFTFELLVRLLAFRNKLHALTDPWFVFDSALVIMMVSETWLLQFLTVSGKAPLGDISVVRLVRLLRITRITRLIRVFPELKVMCKAMLAGLRSASIASMLMAVVTYVFALCFRQLTENSDVGGQRFRTVPASAYTLLVEGLVPDNGETLDMLFGEHNQGWFLGILFCMFIFLVSFTILNMLVGMICDVISSCSEDEKDSVERDRLSDRLWTFFTAYDTNYDGLVSKAEFVNLLSSHDIVKSLQSAGVNVIGVLDDVDIIFEEYGKDDLQFEEFVGLLWQFRATHAATHKSISNLKKSLSARLGHLQECLEVMNRRLNEAPYHSGKA